MEIKYLTRGIEIEGKFYSKENLITGINTEIIRAGGWKLVKIEWDKRGCHCYDIFLCNDVLKLTNMLDGIEIYFGEIAGKHSDVYGSIEKDDISTENFPFNEVEFLNYFPSGFDSENSFLDVIKHNMQDDWEGNFESEEDYLEFVKELKSIIYNY